MSTKISIPDRQDFRTNFLKPLSQYSDSGRFVITKNKITSLAVEQDSGSVLYGFYDTSDSNALLVDTAVISIRQISKLSFFVDAAAGPDFVFNLVDNYIHYVSKEVSLKMFLMDNAVLALPPISEAAIKKFEFDVEFTISAEKMEEILRYKFMTNVVRKLYFYSNEGMIFANYNDKSLENVDELTIPVTKSDAKFPEFAIMFGDLLKKMSFNRGEVKISTRTSDGLVRIEMKEGRSTLQYFLSSTTQ